MSDVPENNSGRHGNSGSPQFRSLASRICVVLCGALYGGNAGAVARSMNNFGFSDLRFAGSPQLPGSDDARRMAMHSKGILDTAGIFENLEQAVADCHITIGATRRMGKHRGNFFTPAAAAQAMAGLDEDKRIALIFGPEDKGLSNEDLELCDWLLSIRTFSEFDSLNLSHAVTVVLYEISRMFAEKPEAGAAGSKHTEGLVRHLEEVLRIVSFLPEGRDTRRAMLMLRRMIGRGGWSRNETDLFHAILAAVEKAVGKE